MVIDTQNCYFRSYASHLTFSDSMKPSIVLLVLSIFPTIHGLSCISDQRIIPVQLANFDLDKFKEMIDQLPSMEVEGPCRVWMTINYVQQQMTIRFTKLQNGSKLASDVVQFDTIMQPDQSGMIHLGNFLEHACSKSDRCEKQFLYDHLEWLREARYTDLLKNAAPLLVGQGSSPGKYHVSSYSDYEILNRKNIFFIYSSR